LTSRWEDEGLRSWGSAGDRGIEVAVDLHRGLIQLGRGHSAAATGDRVAASCAHVVREMHFWWVVRDLGSYRPHNRLARDQDATPLLIEAEGAADDRSHLGFAEGASKKALFKARRPTIAATASRTENDHSQQQRE
jgi:hypothetical protein